MSLLADTLMDVNLVRHIEKRLENAMEGLAGKMFKGPLHPVELASRMIREADLAVKEGPAGPEAPNAFEVRIPPTLLTDDLPGKYLQELAKAAEDTAVERGWRLAGPVRVTIIEDPTLTSGISCSVSTVQGPIDAWGRLTGSDGKFDLHHNRLLIGRSESADVTISQTSVSRSHARFWRDGAGVWVQDLNSSNGTSVNGTPISATTLVPDGSVVSFGPSAYTLRLLA